MRILALLLLLSGCVASKVLIPYDQEPWDGCVSVYLNGEMFYECDPRARGES
jgi:hypothetical protein